MFIFCISNNNSSINGFRVGQVSNIMFSTKSADLIVEVAIEQNIEFSNNSILGMIEQIIQTGANDVFVVRTPSGELLVPDIADFIVSVDEENNLMTIKNEDGL